jgi:hypothetical protein
MSRTDREVVEQLRALFVKNDSGNDRYFLIDWPDLCFLKGEKLFAYNFYTLCREAELDGLYVWNLGEHEGKHQVAILEKKMVSTWKQIPTLHLQ